MCLLAIYIWIYFFEMSVQIFVHFLIGLLDSLSLSFYLRNLWLPYGQKDFLLFCSRSFIVLGLPFRSDFLVNFSVWCELRGSRFIFFLYRNPVFQHCLLKRLFSLRCICVGLYLPSFLCSREAFVCADHSTTLPWLL